MSDKIAEIRARRQEGIRAGADADRACLLAEVERQTQHIEELRSKIDAERSCACSFDAPGDVCLAHSPTLAEARAEVKQLIRERDEARAWAAKLLATLEMVRDADNDCRVEGWATIPDAVRRSIDEALEAKP